MDARGKLRGIVARVDLTMDTGTKEAEHRIVSRKRCRSRLADLVEEQNFGLGVETAASEVRKISMVSIPSKSDVRGSAEEIADKADGIARDAARSAGSKLEGAGDAMGDLYAKGAGGVRDALNEMPASLSDVAAAGERIVLRGRRTLDHGVRKQPVEALLLAGAIGYLVGWAASRG